MNEQRQNFLDSIALVSFIIGIMNYDENVDQSTMSSAIQTAVEDIHAHLRLQDEKIDKIFEILRGEQNDG